ncbi:hypothetical protein KY290_033455 [Solanum tuberosum]|uniref:RNase H type-1 domain-containing protein n=1 Tax=Solanum tuberosum TaxID=4113 RepID=A0ABQ7U0C5_SOLTU|nr:hypothetical protein KY289_032809 [Solanum tuberosum]KAH0647453.1 hypothetical protein KY285_032701 [Solanum tuberosum]KAH0740412.1 hypothetical protein KY290_033455 [Solanum tuberosum]
MRKKLASWKVNLLTIAGQLTLATSNLNSIRAYAMQYLNLPKKTCNSINKIQRDFLWGTTVKRKGYIMSPWEKVASPKDFGGLGLQRGEVKNKTILTSLAWRLYTNHTSLWANTLIDRYHSRRRLPTQAYLHHIGIDTNPSCPICHLTHETITYIFFDCHIARNFQLDLGVNISQVSFQQDHGILTLKDLNPSHDQSSYQWIDLMPFALWQLWLNKNHNTHNGKSDLPLTSMVKNKTIEYITDNHSPGNHNAMVDIHVKWFPPPIGSYKLNTNGAFSKHKRKGGIVGVIRDVTGNWILGFHKRSSSHNHTMTELEALLNGLNITHSYNLMPIEIKMDSIEAIKLLENMHPTYHSIILHCRSILKKLGNPMVRHSLRQGNKVADILSRLGCKLTHTNQWRT